MIIFDDFRGNDDAIKSTLKGKKGGDVCCQRCLSCSFSLLWVGIIFGH